MSSGEVIYTIFISFLIRFHKLLEIHHLHLSYKYFSIACTNITIYSLLKNLVD